MVVAPDIIKDPDKLKKYLLGTLGDDSHFYFCSPLRVCDGCVLETFCKPNYSNPSHEDYKDDFIKFLSENGYLTKVLALELFLEGKI